MTSARESKLTKLAASQGLTLQRSDAGFRLIDINGTFVAAMWTSADGFGLTLDQVETALHRDDA
ncbi:MAG: hypothetical protein JWN99_1250 [Ilumatobacteraceae bacterium]|nr:hypothetical protein [Ilumatobacteraceae bacterium]